MGVNGRTPRTSLSMEAPETPQQDVPIVMGLTHIHGWDQQVGGGPQEEKKVEAFSKHL